ncbi:hypothetical protein GF412_00610 [Candidatus Micrarchaeota archaeon]|nr:hypothetical protein [Candidatus Micrarchaeota archaeon]MBD3417477.1 hypothetical protein [Candidatus Micrarchaeota archaeon]
MPPGYKLGRMDRGAVARPYKSSRSGNGRAGPDRNALSHAEKKELDKRLLRAVSSSSDSRKLVSLLERGADPNARDRKQDLTALMIAARKGKAGFVGVLLDFGADPHLKGHGSSTAYELAQTWGHWDVLDVFREKRANTVYD